MKERRAIAPIKPVCLEGPLCFTSTAHGPSSSSTELLLSSLLPLSPTFSGSPLNLMVPSSSASRPCDSWRASVLYYTTVPQGVRTPLSSDLCFCHTHGPCMYTQTCRDRNTHSHTHTAQWYIASNTRHTHLCRYPGDATYAHVTHGAHIPACMRSTKETRAHTLVTHSHNTRAFTHSWCSATVTLDTGSLPPVAAVMWGCATQISRMTGFSRDD